MDILTATKNGTNFVKTRFESDAEGTLLLVNRNGGGDVYFTDVSDDDWTTKDLRSLADELARIADELDHEKAQHEDASEYAMAS